MNNPLEKLLQWRFDNLFRQLDFDVNSFILETEENRMK